MATFNLNETPVFLARIMGANGPSSTELLTYNRLKKTTTPYYADIRSSYKTATGEAKTDLGIKLKQIYGANVIKNGALVDDIVLAASYGFTQEQYIVWKTLSSNSSKTVSEEEMYNLLENIKKEERTELEEQQFKTIGNEIQAFLVKPDEIKQLSYSIKNSLHYGNISNYVANHENVVIDIKSEHPFQEDLIDNDDIWSIDNIGYNFEWSPKTRSVEGVTYPPFPSVGAYYVIFKVEFKDKTGYDDTVITPSTLTWTRSVAIINS